MNRNLPLGILFTLLVFLGLSGCASLDSSNKEQLLTAAGFRTRTPTTAKQQEIYASMPAYKLERRVVNNKVLYTYANKKQGVVYIGGEAEYQRYTQLDVEQQIAMTNLATAQVNAMDYSMWGPWGMWW